MSSHQLLRLGKLGEEFAKGKGWGHDKERIWNLKRKEKWNWAGAWWLLGTALHIATLLPWPVKARVCRKPCGCLSTWCLPSEPRKKAWPGNGDLCELARIGALCCVGSACSHRCPGVKTGLSLIFCEIGLLCPSRCPWVLLVQIYLFKLFNSLGLFCFY